MGILDTCFIFVGSAYGPARGGVLIGCASEGLVFRERH